MIEKRLVDEYKLKTRKGITEFEECFYLPVRITGTGDSLRQDKDGNVVCANRERANFFTPEFIKHAATLPILINHPKEGMLTDKNLKDNPIVGNVIDAWIEDTELWGVARVFDKSLLGKFGKSINSTSPAVFAAFESSGSKVSERPFVINHLAFVDKGHWDIGDSIGFDSSEKERVVRIGEGGNEISLLQDASMEQITSSKTANELSAPQIADSKTSGAIEQDLQKKEILNIIEDEKSKKGNSMAEETKTIDAASEEVVEETKVTDADETVEEVKVDDKEVIETAVKDDGALPTEHLSEITDGGEEVEVTHHLADDVIEEVSADEAETEIIDSEVETEEDTQREKVIDEMRSVCDSAHASLKVKMPAIQGRQTIRSVANKFLSMNRGFVSPKYSNLSVDSYTRDLAVEVLADTYSNIAKKSEELGSKVEKGWNDTGKGYSVYAGF